MPRAAREKSQSETYHIMLRGINQQQIFEDEQDYQKFIEIIKTYQAICEYKIFAYCLMGNHIHLLMEFKKEPIEQVFKRIGSKYVYWYNVKYQRKGHLFQDRFKSEPVNDEQYYLTVLRYILQNPENALICKTKDYKWSSIGAYDHKSFVKTEFALSLFSCKKDLISFLFEKNSDECMDLQLTREEKETKDSIVIRYIIGKQDLKSLSIPKRNFYINCMKKNGISIRRISKVTGLSIGMIQRA